MIAGGFSFKPGPALKAGRRKGLGLKGLRQGGEAVLERSNRYVPLEEGTLERSGRVTDNGVDEVAISYDTRYAVRQHEDLTLRHPNGRSAKYLERALAESRSEIAALIAGEVRKDMER